MAIPIGSMPGIFIYMYHKYQPNVGKYPIYGSYGQWHLKNSNTVSKDTEELAAMHDSSKSLCLSFWVLATFGVSGDSSQ